MQHERYETDSYYVHALAQSVVSHGYALWTASPLSYLGYYPMSYPSGAPILLGEFASLTGLTMESSILVMDMILGVIFCLAVFILCRHFLYRPQYALLATLFVLSSSRFVDTTYWNASARGMLVVLLTLTTFIFFRASSMRQYLLLLPAALLAFGCFSTHHMSVLIVLIGLAYVIAAFQGEYVLPKLKMTRRKSAAAFNLLLVLAVVVIAFSYFEFFGKLATMNLQTSAWLNLNPPFLALLVNAAVSYVIQIGLVLVLAVMGILLVFRRLRLGVESLFPFTFVLVLVPLIGNPIYISMIVAPFAGILGTIWLSWQYAKRHNKILVLSFIVALMAASMAFPIWSVHRWNNETYSGGDTVEVGPQVFNDAAYLRVQSKNSYVMLNNNVLGLEFAANGEMKLLAPGIFQIIVGDVTREDLKTNVTWSHIRFPTNLYIWFDYPNAPRVESYVWLLMVAGVGYIDSAGSISGMRDFLDDHSRLFMVIDNKQPSAYVNLYGVTKAALPGELASSSWSGSGTLSEQHSRFSSYLLYSSQRISSYAVQLPG